ncbi:MAG: 3-oxoacyl-[acyl-carrier-protein] reductase [Rhodobacteraceae bacterium]|nr:3-oxoacyl-[acyl-carrier-protein] reductase [Paracoccaceae bacterium]
MLELDGVNALVTGASGGIGGAIARSLAAGGAKVAVSGTRAEKLEQLADEIGAAAVPIVCNLLDRESVAELPKRAVEALGSIEILVNNAGITRDGLLLRMPDSDWQRVLEVNLSAAMILSRGVLRGMMKARWGRIVYVSSVVGHTGNPGQVNYAAAKAGLTGMAKSLASEVANRGITVNLVAPGFVDTEMTSGLKEEQKSALLSRIPIGRMGGPDEIAAAVRFLVSKEASYVTGQTLHVNGGLAMQ